jgi:hypothetical protein
MFFVKRWLLAMAGVAIGWPALAGGLPVIWLCYDQTKDFMAPYQAPDEWPKSAAEIKTIQLPAFLAGRLDDAALRQMFAFLQARGIKFSLEAPMLTPGAGGCGRGVEGYAEAGDIQALAVRIKTLGGRLDDITMDEPLYFGHAAHSFWRPSAGVCRADVASVAADAAQVIAAVRTVFPQVIVGDVEPVGAGKGVEPPDLRLWFAAFQHATGSRLAFLHFDVVWDGQAPALWGPPLVAAWRVAGGAGIRAGIIYNGNPSDLTNVSWTADAARHYRAAEQEAGLALDGSSYDAVFETWMAHPDLLVPETLPGTMTNLILGYVGWRASHK